MAVYGYKGVYKSKTVICDSNLETDWCASQRNSTYTKQLPKYEYREFNFNFGKSL
jgi:hypothetical protein